MQDLGFKGYQLWVNGEGIGAGCREKRITRGVWHLTQLMHEVLRLGFGVKGLGLGFRV